MRGRGLGAFVRSVFGASCLMLAMPAMADDSSQGAALPVIDLQQTDGGVEIVGRITALKAGAFDGEMTIQRRGASGSVSTRQASSVELAVGQSAEIARVSVSHSPGDALHVELILSRDGIAIARAEFTTSPDQ
jgi:hypothetical protein